MGLPPIPAPAQCNETKQIIAPRLSPNQGGRPDVWGKNESFPPTPDAKTSSARFRCADLSMPWWMCLACPGGRSGAKLGFLGKPGFSAISLRRPLHAVVDVPGMSWWCAGGTLMDAGK